MPFSSSKSRSSGSPTLSLGAVKTSRTAQCDRGATIDDEAHEETLMDVVVSPEWSSVDDEKRETSGGVS